MDKIYEKIYRKIQIKLVAAILTAIYGLLIYLKYVLKSVEKGNKSGLSQQNARKIISEAYRCPESGKLEFSYPVLKYSPQLDLSIIVPAYNAADYMQDCLDAIYSQKSKYSFEVIVINDGSTDSTETILEGFKNNHSIKIIHQENSGISAARNRGIEESGGEYLMFVDSDDTLMSGAIENLLNVAIESNADIVQGGFYRFSNKKNYSQKFITPYKEISKGSKDSELFLGFPWGKVFKKDLWKNVRYPLGVWFEDTVIKCIIFNLANKIIICDKLVYAYRVNDKGMSFQSKKQVKSLDTYFVIEKIFASAYENHLEIKYDNYFLDWFFKVQVTGLLWNRIQSIEDEIKESIFVLMADIIRKYGINYNGQNRMTQKIYSTFSELNYQKWKIYAQYLSYRV